MGRIVYERRSRGIVRIEMKEEIRRFAEYLEAEKLKNRKILWRTI